MPNGAIGHMQCCMCVHWCVLILDTLLSYWYIPVCNALFPVAGCIENCHDVHVQLKYQFTVICLLVRCLSPDSSPNLAWMSNYAPIGMHKECQSSLALPDVNSMAEQYLPGACAWWHGSDCAEAWKGNHRNEGSNRRDSDGIWGMRRMCVPIVMANSRHAQCIHVLAIQAACVCEGKFCICKFRKVMILLHLIYMHICIL